MRAKNKYQRRVIAVDKKVKPIGKRIINWANEHILDVPGTRNKYGTLTCYKCNHKWKSQTKQSWQDKIIEMKCPNCKRDIHLTKDNSRTAKDECFFTYVDKIEEFQVVRTFIQYVYYKSNKPPRYVIDEVYRIYLDEEGRSNVVGRLRAGGYYYWSHFNGMRELRHPDTIKDKYSNEGTVYPKWKLQDYVIKAGFDAYVYHESGKTVVANLKVMLTVPNLETVLKTKDEDLISYAWREPDTLKKYWSTLRICWRNNYKIRSWQTYFDMIKAMRMFGKDLRNRHYVCPGNFNIAHTYWTDKLYQRYQKMQEVRNLRADERQKLADWEYQQRLLKKKDEYNMKMLKFKHLEFKFGKLKIVPLMTVDIVEEAGELMHHCIYKTDGYWTKKDNLLFGTYVDGELVETTQYSISNKEVYHSYGKYNQKSKYHDKIVKIIQTGTHKISECLQKKQKQIRQSA